MQTIIISLSVNSKNKCGGLYRQRRCQSLSNQHARTFKTEQSYGTRFNHSRCNIKNNLKDGIVLPITRVKHAKFNNSVYVLNYRMDFFF